MTARTHLCLLPGLDGTGQLFDPLVAALGDRCVTTVVRYGDCQTFEDVVSMARDQLPRDTRISLVAESFSGPVAVRLMAEDSLDIGPSVFSATFATTPFQSLARLAKFLPDGAFGFAGLNRLGLELFGLGAGASPELRARATAALHSVEAGTLKRRISILGDVDVVTLARRVKQTLLYIRATDDELVSQAQGQQLIDELADVTVKDVVGPHLILQARPVVCADLIMAHVT